MRMNILALLILLGCNSFNNKSEILKESCNKQLFLQIDDKYSDSWSSKDTSFFLSEFEALKRIEINEFIIYSNEFFEKINFAFGLIDYEDWKLKEDRWKNNYKENIIKVLGLYFESPLFLNDKIPWSNSLQYSFSLDSIMSLNDLSKLKNRLENYVCDCEFNRSDVRIVKEWIRETIHHPELEERTISGSFFYPIINKGFIQNLVIDLPCNEIPRKVLNKIQLSLFNKVLKSRIDNVDCVMCKYEFSIQL